MSKSLFERKIANLPDDKLQDLLKLRYDMNHAVVDMAAAELFVSI